MPLRRGPAPDARAGGPPVPQDRITSKVRAPGRLRDRIDPAAACTADLDRDRAARWKKRAGHPRPRSSTPTCGWSSRSPSGTSAPSGDLFERISDGNYGLMARGRAVRLLPRQQVQHLCHLGDPQPVRKRAVRGKDRHRPSNSSSATTRSRRSPPISAPTWPGAKSDVAGAEAGGGSARLLAPAQRSRAADPRRPPWDRRWGREDAGATGQGAGGSPRNASARSNRSPRTSSAGSPTETE